MLIAIFFKWGETGGREPGRKDTGGGRGKSGSPGVFRGPEAGDHADKTLKKI